MGRSGVDSFSKYLAGYMKGSDIERVMGIRVVRNGPGGLLRTAFWSKVFVFLGPFCLWIFSMFLVIIHGKKDVCSHTLIGYSVGCKKEYEPATYSFELAIVHSFWLASFTVCEGEEVNRDKLVVCSTGLVFVGLTVSFFDRSLGFYLFSFAIVFFVWLRRKKSVIWFRWLLLLGLCLGFTPFCSLIELFFDDGDGLSEVFYDVPAVVTKPHRFLALEVGEYDCVMSESYFTDRISGGGMTEEERSMALLGDRFLKLLGADQLYRREMPVGLISVQENLQTDDIMGKWTRSKFGKLDHGKKTIGSFSEVMWGEVFLMFAKGSVTYDNVVAAFCAYSKEVISCEKGLSYGFQY